MCRNVPCKQPGTHAVAVLTTHSSSVPARSRARALAISRARAQRHLSWLSWGAQPQTRCAQAPQSQANAAPAKLQVLLSIARTHHTANSSIAHDSALGVSPNALGPQPLPTQFKPANTKPSLPKRKSPVDFGLLAQGHIEQHAQRRTHSVQPPAPGLRALAADSLPPHMRPKTASPPPRQFQGLSKTIAAFVMCLAIPVQ